jgi:hypothetical protein
VKRKFRKKPEIVEAEQQPDGSWAVFTARGVLAMGNHDFEQWYEEVSPLHKVCAMRIDAEGSD